MKERHWNSLIASIRYGQCVLVLGPEIPPGLSAAFTATLVKELEDDDQKVMGTRLSAVAQQYEDSQGFGAQPLRAAAEKFYNSKTFTPSEVHKTLASLPFTLIITTCRDDLLAQALEQAGKTPIRQRYHLRGDKRENPEFVIPGSPTAPVVFHLFGDAREPNSLVLSENDILDFLIAIVSERPPLPNCLLRALKHPGLSFLFVGFGITHWDLRVLLKVLVRALDLGHGGSAIAAEPLRGLLQPDRDETVLFYRRGTHVEVEDTEVGDFLAELARRVDAAGGFSGEAAPIGPRLRVFISYAREDGDLAARVYESLEKAHFEPWLDKESLEGGVEWDERIKSELSSTDFVLLLYTPAFCRKTDSYVNKEVALARDRALAVRGSFLIPLRTAEIADSDRVDALRGYDEMELRPSCFEEDMPKVISTMLREYQRRNR